MKLISYIILLLHIVLNSGIAKAQTNDIWTGYSDESTLLIGFKDNNGNIKIEPKFGLFTQVQKFEHIIAVSENKNEDWEHYYLLKNGKKIGRDSIYIFDALLDCESEGYIRFYDQKNELTGMFNKDGKVAIPAHYSALMRIHNGLCVALKNAVKKHMNHKHNGCDHWFWTGGTNYLLNTKNEILIKDFVYDNLNLYSLSINDKPIEDSIHTNFKGVNGKFYSFIDNEKEIQQFFENEILNNLSTENLIKNCFHTIVYWDDNTGWTTKSAEEYIKTNQLIIPLLKKIKDKTLGYNIYDENFLPLSDSIQAELAYQYDNCGSRNYIKYPLFSITVDYKDNSLIKRDSFDFLKTEEGYKLICAHIKSE